MVTFGAVDIARTIESATLHRGRIVHAQGLVIDADVNPSGTVIVARVRGSEQRPYQQMITLRPGNAGVIIHGTCTCPVRVNCKHVGAVLIEILQRVPERLAAAATAKDAAALAGRDELSHELQRWLGDFDETARNASGGNAYPPEIRQRLIYVVAIEPDRNARARRAWLKPLVTRLGKSGDLGQHAKAYSPSNIFNYQPAKHLRPIDHDILAEIDWLMRRTATPGGAELLLSSHPQIARLMSKILSTGRCRWGDVQGPVLAEGPAVTARPHWVRDAGTAGRQRLVIEPERDADGVLMTHDAVLPLAPPFYINAKAGLAGPLDLGLPPAIAARLTEAPAVNSSEAARLAVALDKRFSSLGIQEIVPLPETPHKVEMRNVQPIPRLELYVGEVRIKDRYSWYISDQHHRAAFRLPLARLAFDYGGEIVHFQARSEVLEQLEGDRLIVMPRNGANELEALDRVGKLGLKPLKDAPIDALAEHAKDLYLAPRNVRTPYDFLAAFNEPSHFLEFSAEAIPKLVAEGWQIAYSDDYPYRIVEGEIGWWADIESSGIDWFSFELGIEFEGERVNLAPQLATMLAGLPDQIKDLARSATPEAAAELSNLCSNLRLHHTLPDGRLLPLPGERLASVLKALMELIGPRPDPLKNGKVRLHRAEAAALAAAAAALGDRVVLAASAERLIALGNDLLRGRTLKDIAPPRSFKAELRPYQAQGLAWLDFLREAGFGGVLADDMGLGKTVQALAYLMREKAEQRLDRPALIIAPTSVLPNWQAEAVRFAPELRVLALRGLDRKQLFGNIANHDLVLTTYPLLMRDYSVLLDHEFHAAILDEAQAIKNPKATVSKLAHTLKARHRLALTGTPLENNLGEVWSLFQFLSPGLLGDESTFRRTFRTPIEKHGCQAAQAFLTRRLKPFMLRRTKQEVAKELPAKTEIVERIRLEGAQRDLYETVRALMHRKVREEIARKGLAKSHIVFLDALLKLRQICCDPRLLKMPQAKEVKQSAKFERLMEMLPEMVAEGRRILLFSQFTSMLELIEAELIALDIPYVTLTGTTTDRAAPVDAFQSGKVPVFLLSLKAGGTGLNLTAADTVIHYDPWWNPAVENQATDRAFRIGQTKPVFVYKLMVEEGIEEAIDLLKARKAALADALFAGASKSGLDFTEADISALFAPLETVVKRRAA
jgi:superfamily II DNA or RNA helicase